MQNLIRQLGITFAGFLIGACAMFWLPWAMAIVFQRSGGGLAPGSSVRMLGMHLMVALLLSAAWLLLNAARSLFHQTASTRVSLRRQCILGATGAGLFYLLYPIVTDSPWVIVLVVVVSAGVLVALAVRGKDQDSGDDSSWLEY